MFIVDNNLREKFRVAMGKPINVILSRYSGMEIEHLLVLTRTILTTISNTGLKDMDN